MTLRVGGTNLELLSDLMNGGACVVTNNPVATMVGDDSTDNVSAWNSLRSQYDNFVIPQGTYSFATPMIVPREKRVVGVGIGTTAFTAIKGTSGQPSVIDLSESASEAFIHLEGLKLTGAADAALYGEWVNQCRFENLLTDGTFTDGVVFNNDCFDNVLEHIRVNGDTVSNYCFDFGSGFNANTCSHLTTAGEGSAANFHVGGGAASTFNSIVCQGGTLGLYMTGGVAHTFNSMYQENVGGNRVGIATSDIVVNTVFNACQFAASTGFADRIACLDLQYAYGMTLNSPAFYTTNLHTPITFAGGGGSGAYAVARVHPDGNVHSIHVIRGGTGYTSDPSVSVDLSGGSGATATAARTGDAVSSVTVTDGGSGYSGAGVCCSIRYKSARRIQVNAPYLNWGSGGLQSAFYPTICRDSGATTNSGIEVYTAPTERLEAGSAMGNMRRAQGYGYMHYLEELDNSGTEVRWAYVPPELTT